jgi:hypothetical protein
VSHGYQFGHGYHSTSLIRTLETFQSECSKQQGLEMIETGILEYHAGSLPNQGSGVFPALTRGTPPLFLDNAGDKRKGNVA